MKQDYISRMYQAGQDSEARRAVRHEIIRENTLEDEDPTYEPSESEIDDAEVEYYAARRIYQYGSPAAQMEYITEYGITAWQNHVAQIKTNIPKPS